MPPDSLPARRDAASARWFDAAVVGALLLGVLAGHYFPASAALLLVPLALFLRGVRVVAPLLSLVALTHVLATADIRKPNVKRLVSLLTVNTVVAALIGLLMGNVIQPGAWLHRGRPLHPVAARSVASWLSFLHRVVSRPEQTLVDYYATVMVVVAIALGLFLRRWRQDKTRGSRAWHTMDTWHRAALEAVPRAVHGLVWMMPPLVFAAVAGNVAAHGLRVFTALAALVAAVLLGLALQVAYYLLRLRFAGAGTLNEVWQGGRRSVATAFATASSSVALPVAYSDMADGDHVTEASAGLGVLVGANFSKDGTMVYLAIAGLFAAQAAGQFPGFSLQLQLLIALGSFLARAITPGVPGAGFVTMVVVFNAVGLPLNYTPLLLTVDWLLDRCRSATNVFGCIVVSWLLDAKGR